MASQFVVEVYHFKLSKSVWHASQSKKVVGFVEGVYANHHHTVRSSDCKVYKGTQYAVPYADELTRIHFHFFIIDSLLAVDLGTATYNLREDKQFDPNNPSTQIVLDVMPRAGTQRIGKLNCFVSVQMLFEERRREPLPSEIDFQQSMPGFHFKRLSRVVNWERIRSLDIQKLVYAVLLLKMLDTCYIDR